MCFYRSSVVSVVPRFFVVRLLLLLLLGCLMRCCVLHSLCDCNCVHHMSYTKQKKPNPSFRSYQTLPPISPITCPIPPLTITTHNHHHTPNRLHNHKHPHCLHKTLTTITATVPTTTIVSLSPPSSETMTMMMTRRESAQTMTIRTRKRTTTNTISNPHANVSGPRPASPTRRQRRLSHRRKPMALF